VYKLAEISNVSKKSPLSLSFIVLLIFGPEITIESLIELWIVPEIITSELLLH
jgi:hypothetical protein